MASWSASPRILPPGLVCKPEYQRPSTNGKVAPSNVEIALVLATSATRLAAAWMAYRLFRKLREWRFGIVTFVLAVTAAFPVLEIANEPEGFVEFWLPKLGGGLAVLLTALILVRTLIDLNRALSGLQNANDVLEQRVTERTGELQEANRSLEGEVAERRRVETALRDSEAALKRNQEELRRLAGKLIAAQEEERRRLARELHDDLSQTLAALALELTACERMAEEERLRDRLHNAEQTVERLADDIHDMSRLLHPSILDDLGLEAAIRAECLRFSEREGIPLSLSPDEPLDGISPECALTFYRITQEALHNISKHAEASSVTVSLRNEEGGVTLRIVDDGRGFDPTADRDRNGLGLVSMGERVRLLSGSLSVDSTPGGGVCVTVIAPVQEVADEQTASVVS